MLVEIRISHLIIISPTKAVKGSAEQYLSHQNYTKVRLLLLGVL